MILPSVKRGERKPHDKQASLPEQHCTSQLCLVSSCSPYGGGTHDPGHLRLHQLLWTLP